MLTSPEISSSDCFSIEVNSKFILTGSPGWVWFDQSSNEITVMEKINCRQCRFPVNIAKANFLRGTAGLQLQFHVGEAFEVEICRKVIKCCKLSVQYALRKFTWIRGVYRNCKVRSAELQIAGKKDWNSCEKSNLASVDLASAKQPRVAEKRKYLELWAPGLDAYWMFPFLELLGLFLVVHWSWSTARVHLISPAMDLHLKFQCGVKNNPTVHE